MLRRFWHGRWPTRAARLSSVASRVERGVAESAMVRGRLCVVFEHELMSLNV